MNIPSHTGVIILAAGASSRLGQPKQLVVYRQKPLLQHMIEMVEGQDFSAKVLVLGAHESTIRQAIRPGGMEIVTNVDWQEGMSGSIRAGLSEVLKRDPATERVLILLSDQPFVQEMLLEALLLALSKGDCTLAASVYRGQAGVPAVFLRTHFTELLALTGDRGARQIILQHQAKAALLPFEQGEQDIDTPEDLARLRQLEMANVEKSTMMRLHIRYFGQLAERRGLSEEWLEWAPTAPTAEELKAFLAEKHGFDGSVQIAVNQVLTTSALLQPGDEIALLPPFAGGKHTFFMSDSRYSRQIMLPEIGEEGQQKLRDARVLIVGVGGLGCPAAQYLAAAGVGNLILVDHDLVDASNLHRQILFTETDLGRPKAVAAREALLCANPGLSIEAKTESLGPGNAVEWFQACDLVIDGTDNFQAKYLINDACLIAGKPWVYASVYRFQGQLSVFNYQNGPTYRCLFPLPPRQQLTCEEVGVLGVLPGLLGVMQAAEALKMILSIGTVFSGKVKWLDLLTMEEQIIHFQRNEAEISKVLTQELAPEVWYCEQDAEGKCYLDVREKTEQPRLSGAQVIEIPLRELADRLPEIPRNQEVFVFCQSGIRSARAIEFLRKPMVFKTFGK